MIGANVGGQGVTAPFTIYPAALNGNGGFTLSPTAVTAGQTVTGTLSLTGPAPTGGLSIAIAQTHDAPVSSDFQYPSSVTIPAGQSSATFVVQTGQVNYLTHFNFTATQGNVTLPATFTVTSAYLHVIQALNNGVVIAWDGQAVGWQHAYDLRMEEETPTTNATNDTLNVADRTDFFGAKHKYHRDCDGLYSPPPYLFDETSSDYQAFLVNGPVVALDDTQIGMDGTTKHFTSVGNNVRACDYMRDRYGSQTNLVYGATAGGVSVPNLLHTVTDPSGRQLTFLWNNLGTTAQPIYRIVEVDGPQYSVVYAYGADANLSSVTLDPGAGHLNRTTTYSYTSVTGAS